MGRPRRSKNRLLLVKKASLLWGLRTGCRIMGTGQAAVRDTSGQSIREQMTTVVHEHSQTQKNHQGVVGLLGRIPNGGIGIDERGKSEPPEFSLTR
ncbi:hypothetical protein EVAR_31062_1 [Eumeta japonica]|uniref:Uncharacterized protein n=1 Tax=Eumeta variegata TaxID=151549 RepID=A0A4C1XH02_EUMVA|nr:hypothetical protein EVAR_31062_1 [Eumeta japonica]